MAEEWGVAPVSEGSQDEWGVKPVPSAPSVPEPKPSFLRRAAGVVGGAVAEIPQIAYEAVAAVPNAMYRGVQHATTTVPAFLGGVAGGSSVEDAARAADVERARIAQSHIPGLPPTLGQGSWLGQGVGYGVNQLVERGIISAESAQGVGDLLAIVGGRGPMNRLSNIPSAVRAIPDRWRQTFPSPEVRAGEMLTKTREILPQEVPQRGVEAAGIAGRIVEQEGVKQQLGISRLPEQLDPNIRRQQLAVQRVGQSSAVKASETALEQTAKTEAATGLETAIPREAIDPARLDFLNKKIEAHNAAQTAAADATTSGAKTAANAGVETAARAALDEVESVIPKAGRLDPLPMGQRLLQRVRGEDGESGIRAVQKVFNQEYEKFDAKGAVAPSKELAEAVKASADISTETGRVLRGFVDESKKVERRLGGDEAPDTLTFAEEAAGKTAGEITFPEDLTLKQFRGLKGEFATAAEMARKANNRPAAMELDRLADIARKGEDAAVAGLGPEAVTQYGAVRAAYKNVFVEAFRRGYGGKMTGFGTQSGGGKIPPAKVFEQLMNRQNAHDFTLALGAEEAAKGGKLLQGLTEADLLKMGQKGAQDTVRPYVESILSTLYENAGGGKKGVAAVEKYLNTNANTINAYGLDLSGLRTAATKYNETMSRLTGAKINTAKGVVEGVIPTADPTKLGNYVFDSASPSSAYKNLLGVSKDPAWKASIDTLMIDELKKRIDGGKDVFSDVKSRAAMEAIWSPRQMKSLKAYHTITKQLSEKAARYGGEELPEHLLNTVAKGGQALPVGLGPMYVAKYGAKFLMALKIIADDKAAWSFIDDALIDPAKADMVVQAYNGSALARGHLKAAIAKEGVAWKKLAQKPVRPAVAGAVSNAGQKKLPNEETKE